MTSRLQITGILLLTALSASPAMARDEAVTLREAIGRSLANNQLLKAASHQEGAAREGVAVSRSRYLPRILLESGAAVSNTPSNVFMMKLDEARATPASDFAAGPLNHPAARADFKTAVTLEQPLLDFSLIRGVELARKEAEAADASLSAERERLAFRVYDTYLEVRRAKAYQQVAQQAAADAAEHSRVATVRLNTGNGLKSDELRGAAEVAEARQRLISARNDVTLARLRLNLVVGGKEGEELDIADEPKLREPSLSQGELIRMAQENRPDLKGGRKMVEKGDVALRQARDAYLPTLYASASYQVNDRDYPMGWDNDSWNAGVSLRWELFDGTRRSHEKERARLVRDAAAEILENQRREITVQVAESVLRREETALRLESARAALSDAEEGMRLVTRRFENGLSAMVELMDAEATLNRARGNLVEVENGYLKAVAQIYYATGVFLKEVMP